MIGYEQIFLLGGVDVNSIFTPVLQTQTMKITIYSLCFFTLIFFFSIAKTPGCNTNRHTRNRPIAKIDSLFLYFPLKQAGQDSATNADALGSFEDTWYSKMLRALNEPILCSYDGDAEIYRFTWLRTFNHPIAIRVEKIKTSVNLTIRMCDGAGGYEPGKMILDKAVKLDDTAWRMLQSKLDDANFWDMPMEDDTMGDDGSEWIIESSDKDKYHAVIRWTPRGTSFQQCGLYFLKLSGISIPADEQY
jgi:hypothetical protein